MKLNLFFLFVFADFWVCEKSNEYQVLNRYVLMSVNWSQVESWKFRIGDWLLKQYTIILT